jgi:hypothetical protein
MAKNPSSVWYWNDWLVDPAVRACSMAARGFWLEMLAIAAAADGYVRVGDKPCSICDLARITTQDKRDVSKWVRELERRGVFSRTEDGVMFCRRMVREAEARAAKRAQQRTKKACLNPPSARHPPEDTKQPELFDNPPPKPEKFADSDSGSVASSQTPPSISKPLESSLDAPRATERKESEGDKNDGEVSQQRCALSKEKAEARAKRKNHILTLRRWSQYSEHLPDEERQHRLEMLVRAAEALERDAWHSRSDEDKRCYDALAEKAQNFPLPYEVVGWLCAGQRPGPQGGLYNRSKAGWKFEIEHLARRFAANGMREAVCR